MDNGFIKLSQRPTGLSLVGTWRLPTDGGASYGGASRHQWCRRRPRRDVRLPQTLGKQYAKHLISHMDVYIG
jgi:hypothetical protein